jgi:PPOX class probable F420-dependent enzyme
VTEDEARDRLADAPVGRLATVDASGRPRVQPCCFVLDGEVVYSAVDAKPKRSSRLARLADIDANPSVCLVVDHYEEDWSKLWWVRLSGQARLLESGPDRQHAIDLLVAKYPQYRADPPKGTVIAVDIDRWASWSGA